MKRLAVLAALSALLALAFFAGISVGITMASTPLSPLVMPSASPRQSDRAETAAPQFQDAVGSRAGDSGPIRAASPSAERSGAPPPSPAAEQDSPPPSAVSARGTVGIASWMPERYGPDYLALPVGSGHRVRICAATCLVMVSTDAGPSLAMQRAPYNRVADIGVLAWERICGLPRAIGLCRVTVERL